jgi:hypothetical protein
MLDHRFTVAGMSSGASFAIVRLASILFDRCFDALLALLRGTWLWHSWRASLLLPSIAF